MDDKFRSRRFQITLLCIISGIILAYFGKMNSDISLVLTVGMGSYNLKDSFKRD